MFKKYVIMIIYWEHNFGINMASIKDSFEETIQDNHAIIKLLLLGALVYYCVDAIMNNKPSSSLIPIEIVTAIILLGFMLICTQNVRRGANRILPTFNIFAIIFEGIKGIIALAPLGIISYFIETFIINILNQYLAGTSLFTPFVWITSGICSSFVFTGYILYSKDFKITDAYNIAFISKFSIDVLIALFFMVLKLALADAIVIVPITYIIWLFFGIPHPIAIYFWSVVAVFSIAMMGHYLAQTDYEIIGHDDD
jgi:hypothetical protein